MSKQSQDFGKSDFRTNDTPVWLSESDGAFFIAVHAQPGAKRDAVVGLYGDRLKIALTAPPVDGKANAALTKFLAKKLGIAKSAVLLTSGDTSRDKRFRLIGVDKAKILLSLC